MSGTRFALTAAIGVAHKVTLPVETRLVAVAGTLEGSLFDSMDRLDETPTLAARFVHVFEWDFDFAADALPGDRFRLLVEKRFAYDEFVAYGNILIAQYQSAGREPLTAVVSRRFSRRAGTPCAWSGPYEAPAPQGP